MVTPAFRPRRIVILGTSGSGKSTVATALGRLLEVRPMALDELAQGPNWIQVPAHELAEKVTELAAEPQWIADGNYIDQVSGLLWPRAEMIVWLDLPLRVILPRLVRRSLDRIVHRTPMFSGNRETWRALVGRDSVLWWAVRSQRRHVRELPGRLDVVADTGTCVVRLRSAAEADRWLADMATASARGLPRATP
ncbi:MAG TPA: hypothetical protein VFQ44_12080 [Streptosporangiaceae bacterium]|nr:hypothetical protein [Streptosporangiaceae bacterium]